MKLSTSSIKTATVLTTLAAPVLSADEAKTQAYQRFLNRVTDPLFLALLEANLAVWSSPQLFFAVANTLFIITPNLMIVWKNEEFLPLNRSARTQARLENNKALLALSVLIYLAVQTSLVVELLLPLTPEQYQQVLNFALTAELVFLVFCAFGNLIMPIATSYVLRFIVILAAITLLFLIWIM